MNHLYPKNPTNVPLSLTMVSEDYKKRVVLAILGVVLFYLCYFGLLVGFSWFTYYMFNSFLNDGSYWELAASVGGLMLVLFTLKFLFKRTGYDDKISIEITQKNHPKLYDFIHQVAKDTNGPKPNKILVNHDVNACVFFNSTLLSLFTPQKKNLLIGLGLVNGLTLSEFKAVMAHEFGHFSQSSMQVGSYVYMANKIIHDMIFERDKWDDILAMWRSIDIRLSFIAWIITPFIWLVRQLMFLIYKLINLLHSSLSREMEFHADKVAVSVSGSDAIVESLWKLEKAFNSWNETLNYTGIASTQKIHSGNLFAHQAALLDQQAAQIEVERESRKTDEQGRSIVFEEKETYSSLSMYASHPSNKDREHNAKHPYIEGEYVADSPWQLFTDAEALQGEVTKRLYLEVMQLKAEEYTPNTARMSQFIAEEKATLDVFGEAYLGNFEQRYLNIPEMAALQASERFSESQVKAQFSRLIQEELPQLMAPVKELDKQYEKLVHLSQGVIKGKEFEYQGAKYKLKDLNIPAQRIVKDRDKLLSDPFRNWDKELLLLSLSSLPASDKDVQLLRIQMLAHFQKDLKNIVSKNNAIGEFYQELANKGQVEEGELMALRNQSNHLVKTINDILKGNEAIAFTPLPNIETLEELLSTLSHNNFKIMHSNSFQNGEFQQLMGNVETLIVNYNRLIQKLIAFLIQPLQEHLEERPMLVADTK